MNTFNDDLAIGKRGEELVISALTARGHSIEDVSGVYEYQRKDIDLRLTKNGLSTTLEVKNDKKSNQTGNVFIELRNRNNKSRNYEGWIKYCEAEYLAFVQDAAHKAHIISRNELIDKCSRNNYRICSGIDSSGYVVPIDDLEHYNSYYCLQLGA
jgi:hypothetical protein